MLISVASGKGGTGKTAVATSLSLVGKDIKLIADCDVEAPNVSLLLRTERTESMLVYLPIPVVSQERCNLCGKCEKACNFGAINVINNKVIVFEDLCHSCGVCSIVCEQGAITEVQKPIGEIWKGYIKENVAHFLEGSLIPGNSRSSPVIQKVVEISKQLLKDNEIGIVDCPPGTSCSMVEAVSKSNLCVLVCEPTPFGIEDLKLAIKVVKDLNIKSAIVINKWGIGNDKEIELISKDTSIPIIGKIVYFDKIAQAYANGISPIKVGLENEFNKIYKNILKLLEK